MERPASDSPSVRDDWWWIFDPRHSLRARAALILGVSAAAFTLLFAWTATTVLRRSLDRQARATFETLAFQMSDKLDRVIYERYHELQVAAGLAAFRHGGSPAERRQVLETLQDNTRDFAWIGFTDASGRVQAATRGVLEGAEAGSRPWFIIGRERPYAAGLKDAPEIARELNESDEERARKFIDLAVPVNVDTGQFAGVLAAHLRWEWAREVQLSVVPEAARRDRLGVTVYDAAGEVLLDSGGSGWSLPPEVPAGRETLRARGALLENTGVGTTYLTGFARSRGHREFRGLGWLVVVRQPADLALSPARELQRVVTTWGLVFAVLFATAGWIAAGRIARRLRAIGTAAERIRGGDVLTMMPRPPGESELEHMCGTFRELVEDLREKGNLLAAENARLKSGSRAADKSVPGSG